MKKLGLSIFVFCCVAMSASQARAVGLYVDSAPNVYGSPDYAAWETAAFAAVVGGTFVNMATGINPANVSTTNFEIQDEVVYSFGDLGKRLHWIYWIPNETVDGLKGSGRFEVSLFNTWDGVTDDFYNTWDGQTWIEPTKWVNYAGGVIGSGGMAWWGAYSVNTQAALDADIASWGSVDETWEFSVKYDGVVQSITSYRMAVPEPSTLLLFGSSVAGMALFRRRNAS